ncbi:MAG TPA: LapA family protein, partial [Candidatus Methylomirabilis sp.]
MLFMIVLSVLLLAVAIFALENAQAVTVRFLYWQFQSSVAVVTLAATAAGVLIAGLVGLASRLRRWKYGRATTGAERLAALPSAPRAPTGPSSAGG